MAKLRSGLALVLALSGCAGLAPPPAVPPEPALAQKVSRLMDGNPCAEVVAGQLAGYRLGAEAVARIYEQPVLEPSYLALNQRRIWVKLADRPGSIVIQYEKTGCRIANSYGADGAVPG